MQLIYLLTSLIPKGKVLTYGRLAKLAGLKSLRQVGKLLHQNPHPGKIPCHRVVNTKGQVSRSFAFGGAKAQAKKLEEEGIVVKNGQVDLAQYLWRPKEFLAKNRLIG